MQDPTVHNEMTRLVLVRHGETAWNRETRIQGHTDIPLSDHGRWQAQQVGKALREEGLRAIYSSDLQRAADFHKRADATFYGKVNPGGSGEGYQLKLAVGDTEVRDFNDWQLAFGYRRVGSDAVLDAFTDSDLGMGGTNLRGYTLGLNYGLYRNTTLGMKYLASENIESTLNSNYPNASFKVNTLQVDLNVRF